MKQKKNQWNRRGFLGLLSTLPVGCLPKQESNTRTTDNSTPPPGPTSPEETPKGGSEVENPDFNTANTTAEETCPPPGVIDLSKLPKVPEALTPTTKAYGPANSALVVIGLERYTHGRLQTIILARSNGQTLFRREVSEADITPEDFVFPFLFEGINLAQTDKALNALTMVVRLNNPGGQEFYKADLGELKVTQVTSGTLPVRTLASRTFDPAQAAHHRQGRFYPQNAALHNLTEERFQQILKDSSFSLIEPAGIPYPFVVARQDSKYQPALEHKDTVITDLLGRPIGAPSEFHDIIQYPAFISEKTVGGTIYRTLIRVN